MSCIYKYSGKEFNSKKELADYIAENGFDNSNEDYPNQMSEFTNHSGGAIGSDNNWDLFGRQFGVINHKNCHLLFQFLLYANRPYQNHHS